MAIKCKCNDPKCEIKINISGYGKQLWFTDPNDMDWLMYLDANSIVELIKELRQALLELADSEDTHA